MAIDGGAACVVKGPLGGWYVEVDGERVSEKYISPRMAKAFVEGFNLAVATEEKRRLEKEATS